MDTIFEMARNVSTWQNQRYMEAEALVQAWYLMMSLHWSAEETKILKGGEAGTWSGTSSRIKSIKFSEDCMM